MGNETEKDFQQQQLKPTGRWTSPRKTRRTKADRAPTSRILPGKTLRTVTIRVSAMVKKVPSRLKGVVHRSRCLR
jgi:hypothetical protein